jgi:hypothetical protein
MDVTSTTTRILLGLALILFCTGLATAQTTQLGTMSRLSIKTTTTTTLSLTISRDNLKTPTISTDRTTTSTTLPTTVRCESIVRPNEKTCLEGVCPQGQRCRFTVTGYDAAGNTIGRCTCAGGTTTTTLPAIVRCEAVQNPSANTCARAVCPNNQRCRFTVTGYDAAGNTIGRCTCAGSVTTTTTLQYTWCSDITRPSEQTCLRGLCPPNHVCRYRPSVQQSAARLTAAVESKCVCVPCVCESTTTTLYDTRRCEAITDAGVRTCAKGICPPDYECMYILSPAAANVGYCKCVMKPTTTTTLQGRCEAITNAGVKQCLEGACPPDYECRYVPSLAAADVGSCRCIKPTTTTLPVKCAGVRYPSPDTCEDAVCPENQECRFLKYTVGNTQMTKCVCLESNASTTTTQPEVFKCEAITSASNRQQCVEGICPPGAECMYVPSPVAAGVGSCYCITPTTTTLPGGVKCERITGPGVDACVEGVCPPDHKCRFVQSATAADVGYCKCVLESDSSTTTLPSALTCSMVSNPSEQACGRGVCRAGYTCEYVVDSAGVSYCKCVEESIPSTTVSSTSPSLLCEDISNPSPNTCVDGACPKDHACSFIPKAAGAAEGECKCVSSKPEREQLGILERIRRTLFGWM